VCPASVIDRAAIEMLFRVRRRRAIELLGCFGGYKSGKTFFIDRSRLIERLEQIAAGAPFIAERARRERLSAELERVQRLAPARKVRIHTAPDVRERVMRDLPAGIHLKPGELRIEFFGAEDLLRHLFELSQAMANGFGRFQEAVEDVKRSGHAGASGDLIPGQRALSFPVVPNRVVCASRCGALPCPRQLPLIRRYVKSGPDGLPFLD
jgi:hypothetical protein